MNYRSSLIFLTGALVGGIFTYLFVGSPENQIASEEIKITTKSVSEIATQSAVPATVEVLDVPKYPELENERLPEDVPSEEVASEEVNVDEADNVPTQLEKFERSIASEEQPAEAVPAREEDMKLEEPDPYSEPEQEIGNPYK